MKNRVDQDTKWIYIEGENLKRPNVEWPIFRNPKIANSKITKHELFDKVYFRINSLIFSKLF